MKIAFVVAAVGMACLVSTSSFAVDYGAENATPSSASKPDRAAMQARSQECVKEAEVRGLKGRLRREFRAKCMKGDK